MKKLILAISIFLLFNLNLSSQDTISSAGNDYKHEDFNYSWTIGEPVINTIKKSNIIMTQGFHQGEMINQVIKNKKKITSSLSFNMYPVPTYGKVNLKINSSEVSLIDFTVTFYDSEGHLVVSKKVNKKLVKFDIQNSVPGVYFVIVKDNSTNELIGSMRVTKL